MSGVRVSYIPKQATEKGLHAYFSNPSHGGGHITSVHYPMFDDDAVIIFEEIHTADTVQQCRHTIYDKTVIAKSLPQFQVFRTLKAEIEPTVSSFLETSEEARDEIIHHGNIDYHYDSKMHISYMTGTWYQLEWAWKLINDFMHLQQEALTKSAYMKDTEDRLKKVLIRGVDDELERDMPTERFRSLEIENKANMEGNGSIQLRKGTMKIPGDENVTISIPVEYQLQELDSVAGSVDTRTGVIKKARFEVNASAEMKVENKASKIQRPLSEQGSLQDSKAKTGISRSLSVEDKDCRDLGSIEFTQAGLKVSLYTGEITLSETEAIVNVGMDSRMGVCSAISSAAGPMLSSEVEDFFAKHGKLETGDVMCTSAGGMLHDNVRCVLHTVGPLWIEDLPQDVGAHQLMKTFLNCLSYANNLKLTSVVFPAISTGMYMGSLEVCAKCFLDAILLFTYEHKGTQSLKEVHLVTKHEDGTANMVLALRQLLKKGMDLLTVEVLEETDKMDKKMKKNPGLIAKVKAKVSDFLSGPSKAESPMGRASGISGSQKRAATVRLPTSGRPLPKPPLQAKGRSSRI